jgi:MSHA pilin protein MshA
MKSKYTVQKGFTLIELIITIVVIGVLAAVAIPKFQNLRNDAEQGVAAGVGAALASATSVNYARSVVPGANPGLQCPGAGCTWYSLATCADIETNKANLADIPAGGYTIGPAATALANGLATATCTVTSPGGATADFKAYGAS